MRMRWLVTVALLLVFALSSMPVDGAGLESGQWSMAGQNLDNTRHQSGEDKLSPDTAGSMLPKWMFEAGGDISATPRVFGATSTFWTSAATCGSWTSIPAMSFAHAFGRVTAHKDLVRPRPRPVRPILS